MFRNAFRKKDTLSDILALRANLPLPPLLIDLINAGEWREIDQDLLRKCLAFELDPVEPISSHNAMLLNSGPLMPPGDVESEQFHEYRGSMSVERTLPWIDIEKTLFIMCNQRIGDDCGIALDYRTGQQTPMVIGSDWYSESRGVIYRRVAGTFEEFAWMLGLARR
ncbi:MAG: hypothetical protein KDA80_04815 [Planctomycetaceae bacterium]|nr:hypothetical protein [Planctomycetaceae bacterium]